jgi:hypothetical protein
MELRPQKKRPLQVSKCVHHILFTCVVNSPTDNSTLYLANVGLQTSGRLCSRFNTLCFPAQHSYGTLFRFTLLLT